MRIQMKTFNIDVIASAMAALFLMALAGTPSSAQAQLHAESCGRGSTTVVFLHDGLFDSSVYEGVWSIVCKTETINAVRYDRWGYGKSPAATENYSESYNLGGLISQLKPGKVVLVASSSSAAIAIDFTLRHPESVAGLILAAPSVGGYVYSQAFINRNAALAALVEQKDIPAEIGRAHV